MISVNYQHVIAMIQRGEIQRNESIDFLDNLDFDFFKMENFNSNDRDSNDGTMQFQPFADTMHGNQEFSFDQQFDDDKKSSHDYDKRKIQSDNTHIHHHSNTHANNTTANHSNAASAARPRNASIDSMLSFLGNNNYRNRHDSMGSFSYDLDSLAHQPDPYSHVETSAYPASTGTCAAGGNI